MLGTKQDRDLAKYEANVTEINRYGQEFLTLSNDELRTKTLDFRSRIADYLSNIDAEIDSINQKAKDAADFDEKDAYFKEVDELRKERDKALEDVLRTILSLIHI